MAGGARVVRKCDRARVITEVSTVLDFLIFACCLYILFVSLFHRPWFSPLTPPTVLTNGTTSNHSSTPDVDYGIATATVLVILMCALALGRACEWATLPSLLGMLLAGIALHNIPLSFLDSLTVPRQWSTVLRKMAFVVILLRGGLSLDGEALKKMKGACIRLALSPCTVEAVVIAISAKLIFGLSILFGLLLGFVLAAVSPAVVVPSMIRIAQDGYGSGVTTLVVAAASLDDVYAITLFSLCLSILFATGDSILMTIGRAPLEVVGGCVLGGFVGYGLRYTRPTSRLFLLLACSMAMFFGCERLSIDSAGAMSVLVSAFVAASHWRLHEVKTDEEGNLRSLWELIFQPLLFGLIGFELTLSLLSARLVLLGILVLAIGVAARTATAFVAVMGSGMSSKQRLFVALAWLPKATVQAALAPVALDMTSRGNYGSDYEEASLIVFSLAVISILTTAPIGAAVIRLTAPLLLEKDTVDSSSSEKSTVEVESGEEMQSLRKNSNHED